jgi:heat shock protein HtpX
VPLPRFAMIQDMTPNSFGVGTRPKKTIIGITSGLVDELNRDELEAVLSYEVSRIGSWDIALSSWAVALTSGAIATAEADDLKAIVGWIPARMAEWLQAWALRDQGEDRDQVAIQFTRHPEALITALAKLDADQGEIIRVSRATAPLWIEVPEGVYAGALSSRSKRLGTSFLLQQRIGRLTELAGAPLREPADASTGAES